MIDKLIEKLADALGTNWAIFVFASIAFVPLYFQLPRTIIEWQNWVSQTCIQLVALAILQRGTQIEGTRTNQLLQETHDKELEEFGILKDILAEVKDIHNINCRYCIYKLKAIVKRGDNGESNRET
jgi:hypothetical protein